MKAGSLKFEFNLQQGKDGLLLTSPDIDDLAIGIQGSEDPRDILVLLEPTLNFYLVTYYDMRIERCLVDIGDYDPPLAPGKKLTCTVVPRPD